MSRTFALENAPRRPLKRFILRGQHLAFLARHAPPFPPPALSSPPLAPRPSPLAYSQRPSRVVMVSVPWSAHTSVVNVFDTPPLSPFLSPLPSFPPPPPSLLPSPLSPSHARLSPVSTCHRKQQSLGNTELASCSVVSTAPDKSPSPVPDSTPFPCTKSRKQFALVLFPGFHVLHA